MEKRLSVRGYWIRQILFWVWVFVWIVGVYWVSDSDWLSGSDPLWGQSTATSFVARALTWAVMIVVAPSGTLYMSYRGYKKIFQQHQDDLARIESEYKPFR
jgi:hypothetical protein